MKLFYHPYSSSSFKVRSLVQELGIPVEMHEIDLPAGEQRSPGFLAKNPNGKVPTLEDDGFVVWESNAILSYLAARHPERGLLPGEPRALALTQQWLQWQATTFAPSTKLVLWETFDAGPMGRSPDPDKLEEGLKRVARDLTILDAALDGREWLCGPLTIADFSIGSGLALRRVMGIDVSPYANVKSWLDRYEARESVKRTLPQL